MSKVTLPKEIAEAIKDVRRFYRDAEIIKEIVLDEGRSVYATQMDVLIKEYRSVGKDFLETLISALVNGYEVEKSPEDKLREYIESNRTWIDRPEDYAISERQRYVGRNQGVMMTLSILGITVEGINDNKTKGCE